MRPDGWVFLAASWGLIIGLCAFCFLRMLSQHQRRRH